MIILGVDPGTATTGWGAIKDVKKRNSKISKEELEKRAEIISIAAIKYSMLKQSPVREIIFQREEALNFEGNTGPYLLYSYARASSIVRKLKKPKEDFSFDELEKKESELILLLHKFQEILEKSYNDLNPSYIANYSYQLAKVFNEFYNSCPVKGSTREKFRLDLVKSFRQVIKNSLYLLGIDVLEEM